MRSTTRSTIRYASAAGAVALAGAGFFQASPALADSYDSQSAQPSASATAEATRPAATETATATETAQATETAKATESATAEASATEKATATESASATESATATEKASASETAKAETVTTTVWWLLPAGVDHATASQYTQTRISGEGDIPCGRTAQVDTYRGTQDEINSLGSTLTPGEDAQVYVDSHFVEGSTCESPTPTPTEQPSRPSSSVTPSTPASTTPSSPASTPSTPDVTVPLVPTSPSATPTASTSTPTPEVTVPLQPTDTQSTTPAVPQLVQTPSVLPHTGDQGDGVSPFGIGAGLCGIVFAGSFLGRRKH